MKKNELLSVFRSLQSSKGRTSLAVAVGVLAMMLLLLSEYLLLLNLYGHSLMLLTLPELIPVPAGYSHLLTVADNCRTRSFQAVMYRLHLQDR